MGIKLFTHRIPILLSLVILLIVLGPMAFVNTIEELPTPNCVGKGIYPLSRSTDSFSRDMNGTTKINARSVTSSARKASIQGAMNIRINEIKYDAPGGDTPDDEYIELYVVEGGIDPSFWYVTDWDSNNYWEIPASCPTVLTGEFLVIHLGSGSNDYVGPVYHFYVGETTAHLTNLGEPLSLCEDNDGTHDRLTDTTHDFVAYGDFLVSFSSSRLQGWPNDGTTPTDFIEPTGAEYESLQLIGSDLDNSSNWRSATPTVGKKNELIHRYHEEFDTKDFLDINLTDAIGWGQGKLSMGFSGPDEPIYHHNYGRTLDVWTTKDYAYLAGHTDDLRIINVSDPTNPSSLPDYPLDGMAFSVWVVDNYAYVAVGSAGLAIVNISDPTNPGPVVYRDTNGSANNLVISGNFAYISDSTSGLAIINISDPLNPSQPIYRNIGENALDVVVNSNYAFFAGSTHLVIIDISDPSDPGDPIVVNLKEGLGPCYGIDFKDDYVFLAVGDFGLASVNVSNPTSPGDQTYFSASDLTRAYSIDVHGNYAYIADFGSTGDPTSGGFAIIDISDPTNPGPMIYSSMDARSEGVFITDDHAYVVGDPYGLAIFGISKAFDFINPSIVQSVPIYKSNRGFIHNVTVCANQTLYPKTNIDYFISVDGITWIPVTLNESYSYETNFNRKLFWRAVLEIEEGQTQPPIINSLSFDFDIYIDETAPFISLSKLTNDTVLRSDDLIGFNFTDFSFDNAWCHWDSEDNRTLVSPYEVSVPTDEGYHWLTIYANDSVGNVAVQYYRWWINQVPNINLVSQTNGTLQMNGSIIEFVIRDSNLAHTWYAWDDGVNQSFSIDWNISLSLSKGWHRLTVYANDTDGYMSVSRYLFYCLGSASLTNIQVPTSTVYSGESFIISFTIANSEAVPLNLTLFILSSEDEVLQGNGSQILLAPSESKTIELNIKPTQASIHELTILLYQSGLVYHQFTLDFNVEPQWMSSKFWQPIVLSIIAIIILISVAILMIIGGMYTLSYINYSKRAREIKNQIDLQGFFDVNLAQSTFNEKEWQRFQKQLGDHSWIMGDVLATPQYLKKKLRDMIWTEGSISMKNLLDLTNLDQTTITKFLKDIPDVKVSLDLIVYSDQNLEEWLIPRLENTLETDITEVTTEKQLSKDSLISIIKKTDKIILSIDQTTIFSSRQLQLWLRENIARTDQFDLHSAADDLQISLEHLLQITEEEPHLIIQDNRFILTLDWLADQLSSFFTKNRRIIFSSFVNQLNITGLKKSIMGELIVKKGLQGIHTSDWGVFLSMEFVRAQFREMSKLFADIEFNTICESLGIIENQVLDVLTAAIEANLIIGMIDRVSKKFIIREIPTSLTEQLIAGQLVPLEQITQTLDQSLEQSFHMLQENLPSSTYVLTREKAIIRVEQITPSCQVCGTSTSAEQFLKCAQCARDLCWNHFEELGEVGRAVCPYCDGALVFLPQYCEKCHLDYIRVPKSKDACEFCGYPLTIKKHLLPSHTKYLTSQERPVALKKVEDDFTKDSKKF